jgi:hypothetical protein
MTATQAWEPEQERFYKHPTPLELVYGTPGGSPVNPGTEEDGPTIDVMARRYVEVSFDHRSVRLTANEARVMAARLIASADAIGGPLS